MTVKSMNINETNIALKKSSIPNLYGEQPMIPSSPSISKSKPDQNFNKTENLPTGNDIYKNQFDRENSAIDFEDEQRKYIKSGTFYQNNYQPRQDTQEDAQEEVEESEDEEKEGFKKQDLDEDAVFEDQFETHRKGFEKIDFQDKMIDFVKTYGSIVEIPGKIVLDSKFFPKNSDYCIQVINYTQPSTDNLVYTHYEANGNEGEKFDQKSQDWRIEKQQYQDLYSDPKYGRKCILKILHSQGAQISTVKEVLIPYSKKIYLQFSPDCEYLAIFWKHAKKFNRLALYKINGDDISDLEDTFDQIEKFESQGDLAQLDPADFAPNILFDQSSSSFDDTFKFLVDTKKVKFCNNSSHFLACYNINQAVIINLSEGLEPQDRIVQQFTINEKYFEGIFHLQMASIEPSEEDELPSFRCDLACLSANSNQIIVFDIKDAVDDENQEKIEQDSTRSLTVQDKDDTENMNVKISTDFTQVAFTHINESYLLTETHKCIRGHNMTLFNNIATQCRTTGKEIPIGTTFKRCTFCAKMRDDGDDSIEDNQDQSLECQNTKFCDYCQPYGEHQEDCEDRQCLAGTELHQVTYTQTKITWMKGKTIRYIIHAGQTDFMFVCCKEYDRDLDIQSSCYRNFKIGIKRQIEPNSIKVFDCFLSDSVILESDTNLRGVGSQLKIISTRDDEFFIDELNPLATYFSINKNIKKLTDEDKQNLVDQKDLKSIDKQDLIKDQVLNSSQDESQVQGFSCFVPYLSLAEVDANYQLIFNLNDPNKIIHRIKLPSKIKKVMKSWITQTFDLFILGMTEIKPDEDESFGGNYVRQFYELYYVDLDKYQQQSIKKNQIFRINYLMRYEIKESNGTSSELLDFHVRGSSKKEKINLNKKVMAFFYHEQGIVYWNEKMKDEEVELVVGNAPDFRQKTELYTFFDRKDDENIFYASHIVKKDGTKQFRLDQIKINFNEFRIKNQYSESEYLEKVMTYGYDYAEKTLILLTKPAEKRKGAQKKVKIVDLDSDENRVILNMKVKNKELIGRLKSQLFFLVNGHIYYNNNIIKVRYELLRKNNIRDYDEMEIFDYYEDNISLELNERVLAQMPVSQHDAHRLIFMTKNKKSMKRSRIIVLPYLHERRLYYGKLKKDCEYFQSAQRIIKKDSSGKALCWKYRQINVNLTAFKYYVYSLNGILENRVDFKQQVLRYGKPKAVSNNGQVFLFKKTVKDEDGKKDIQLTVLWMTPMSLFKMKSFRVRGAINSYIQTMSREFEGDQEDDDKFNEVSEAIRKNNFVDQPNSKNDNSKQCSYYFQVNDNMDVAVQIIPPKAVAEQQRLSMKQLKNPLQIVKNKLDDWILKQFPYYLFYVQKGTVDLPQESQGLQSARQNSSREQEVRLGKKEFIAGMEAQDQLDADSSLKQDQNRRQREHLFLTTQCDLFKDGINGYSINNQHIFFWNERKIWYYDMDLGKLNFTDFKNLRVDPNDTITKIKRVRTSSKTDMVAIVIRQSKTSDFVMTYDVKKDNERQAFDHDLNPQVFWGFEGEAYSTEEDRVYIMSQGVVLKCFGDVRNIKKEEKDEDDDKKEMSEIEKKRARIANVFGMHQGHKFDTEGHSWILSAGYLSLSYSYMTFIMNRKMQELDRFDNDDYLFDEEQYNYVMGKKTALHDKNLINNSEKLQFVLKNFLETDKFYLEQLQYQCAEDDEVVKVSSVKKVKNYLFGKNVKPPKITPLHLAHQQQNNKSINIILKYLAELEFTQFKTFGDLAPDLVGYTAFIDFLYEQTFQTTQMLNKSVLRFDDKSTEDIVKIQQSFTSYIDDLFYANKMQESHDPQALSYSVKVKALEVGWILNDKEPDGLKFLTAISNSDRNDLFELEAIQILIEWLYAEYKAQVVLFQGPQYVITLIFYLALVFMHEDIQKKIHGDDATNTLPGSDTPKDHNIVHSLAFCNAICAILCAIGVFMQTSRSKVTWLYWSSVWPYYDVIYSVFSLIVSIQIVYKDVTSSASLGSSSLRQFEAITALVIWTKSLYFLRRVDQMNVIIETLFQMFGSKGIYPFILVMLIIIFAFGNSFWLIGRNQLQFDKLESEDSNEDNAPPLYAVSVGGAFRFIFQMSLGEVGNFDFYERGDKVQHHITLWILFIVASFIILVHLMNMLIAVMGQIQADYLEVEQQTLLKNKLNFVIINWHYVNAIGDQKYKINYLIAAMVNEEDDDDIEIIKELQEDFAKLKLQHKEQSSSIKTTLKKIQQKLLSTEKDKDD